MQKMKQDKISIQLKESEIGKESFEIEDLKKLCKTTTNYEKCVRTLKKIFSRQFPL